MTDKPKKSGWFDESTSTSILADQAQRLETFLAAVADGVIDQSEVEAQEARLVKKMKEVEPLLDAALHEKVTGLLLELVAYDLMQVMHTMHQARPKTAFRG
ncbi:MAG: hypothetical protein ACYC6Y_12775 [Thermoguttaceae bacterium]